MRLYLLAIATVCATMPSAALAQTAPSAAPQSSPAPAPAAVGSPLPAATTNPAGKINGMFFRPETAS